MQVWIGVKQGEEYVCEWTGEIEGEDELGVVIAKIIANYRIKSGQFIWGMTIMIDEVATQRERLGYTDRAQFCGFVAVSYFLSGSRANPLPPQANRRAVG
jgi:hypothetical protein